jgi:hypothetical protein
MSELHNPGQLPTYFALAAWQSHHTYVNSVKNVEFSLAFSKIKIVFENLDGIGKVEQIRVNPTEQRTKQAFRVQKPGNDRRS